MKYEVMLKKEEIYKPTGEYKSIKIIVENLRNPRIIDDRLIFFAESEEEIVFNKNEWMFWKKLRESDDDNKNWDWEEIQKKNEKENCI